MKQFLSNLEWDSGKSAASLMAGGTILKDFVPSQFIWFVGIGCFLAGAVLVGVKKKSKIEE